MSKYKRLVQRVTAFSLCAFLGGTLVLPFASAAIAAQDPSDCRLPKCQIV